VNSVPKAVKDRDPILFMVRGDFVGERGAWFERATFQWARKHYPAPKLKIAVRVWPENDKPQNPRLEKEYTPDDWKGAQSYAKKMIEESGAVLVSIRGLAYTPKQSRSDYEGWHVIEDESWKPASEEVTTEPAA
jgi:hypothetical protein